MEEMLDFVYLLGKSFIASASDPTTLGAYLVIGAAAVVMLMLLDTVYSLWRRRKARYARHLKQYIRVMKGKRMSPKDREEYEKFLVEDFLTTGLEEMYYLGQISKEKRDWWYAQFAQKMNLKGLVRSMKRDVKEQIKRRMKSDLYSNVVKFPDTKEEVEAVSMKKFKGGIFSKRQSA